MVNTIVLGPSASGKTTLCYKLTGLQCDTTHVPTMAVDYMQCTVNKTQFNVWDTPACINYDVPDIARGVMDDCDVIVICYDGRREWSPMPLCKTVGKSRVILALTDNRAYNWPTAKEMYDIGPNLFMCIPVIAAHSSVNALMKCILDMSTRVR